MYAPVLDGIAMQDRIVRSHSPWGYGEREGARTQAEA